MGGVPAQDAYVAERLDHLGIVAEGCREIGLAEWLDAQDVQSHERVGVGTAMVAMVLNAGVAAFFQWSQKTVWSLIWGLPRIK